MEKESETTEKVVEKIEDMIEKENLITIELKAKKEDLIPDLKEKKEDPITIEPKAKKEDLITDLKAKEEEEVEEVEVTEPEEEKQNQNKIIYLFLK